MSAAATVRLAATTQLEPFLSQSWPVSASLSIGSAKNFLERLVSILRGSNRPQHFLVSILAVVDPST